MNSRHVIVFLVTILALSNLSAADYLTLAVAYADAHCAEVGAIPGNDCAHFVAQIIAAGGCLPGYKPTDSIAKFCQGGGYVKQEGYDLCFVDSHSPKWPGLKGLGDYLKDNGWLASAAAKAGCAVLGDAGLGPWSHAAFAVADGIISAHSKSSCRVAIGSVFSYTNAIWCPPSWCQPPPCVCTPCEECINGKCQPKNCGACKECVNGNCVPNSVARSCNPCQQCVNNQCVLTQAAQTCNANKCMFCNANNNGKCDTKVTCSDNCFKCDSTKGTCTLPSPFSTDCTQNKCKQCVSGKCVDTPVVATCTDGSPNAQSCRACNPSTGQCAVTTTCTFNGKPDLCKLCQGGQCKNTAAFTACKDDGGQLCRNCNPATGTCDVSRTCDKCSMCKTDRTGAYPFKQICVPNAAFNSCKDDGGQQCRNCNPQTGTCDVSRTCDKCSMCKTDRTGAYPFKQICVPNAAFNSCKDDGAQQCRNCNPQTGTCDVTRTCSKCETCVTNRQTGETACVPIANKCDKCSKCVSKVGDPTDGTCVRNDSAYQRCYNDQAQGGFCSTCEPATGNCVPDTAKTACNGNKCMKCDPKDGVCRDGGNCDACSFCKSDTSPTGFTCQPKQNNCPSCQICTLPAGTCAPRPCAECQSCDLDLNACAVTVNATCGSNPECFLCGVNGICQPASGLPCTSVPDNNACLNPVCGPDGTCGQWVPDSSSIGKQCKPDEECQSWVCALNGSCISQTKPEGATCTSLTNPVPIDDQCQLPKCDGNGGCVVANVIDGTVCLPPPGTDLNVTLCRSYACLAGKCVTTFSPDYTNCSHHTSIDNAASGTNATLCDYMTCLAGMCVWNSSVAACAASSSSNTGAIVGGVVGAAAAAILVAGVVAAYFALAKPAAPIAAGAGGDEMAAALLVNPTYSNPAAGESPIYGQL